MLENCTLQAGSSLVIDDDPSSFLIETQVSLVPPHKADIIPKCISTPTWKRLLDIVGSATLLVILSPLFLVLAIYIKLVSRGSVFFTQYRIGAGCNPFKIFKFRTMHQCVESEAKHREYVESLSDQDAPAMKPSYGKRLIPGAEFLRGHSIDELPQLLNVLFGTMSLVGPRPEVLEVAAYRPEQLRRFEVLPGITGLWQVSGKNRLSFKRMIELDIEYIDRRSPAMDLSILVRTFRVVFHRDNT